MGTLEERSAENSKKAQQFPKSVQFAIVQVMPNTVNGAYWGFTDMRTIRQYLEDIAKDNNLSVKKLGSNDCLVEVNPAYLLKALNMIDAEAFNHAEMDKIKMKMAEAQEELVKFLIAKGKAGNFSGTVGVYCINNVPTISYKGTNYPAFRLPLNIVQNYLTNFGYQIQVGNRFVDASQVKGQELYDACKLAPTKTGVFINIKAVRPAQWYMEAEKARKQNKKAMK